MPFAPRRLGMLGSIGLCTVCMPLVGQGDRDRTAFDSLLTRLEMAVAPAEVPTAASCERHRGTARKLCKGLLALKRGELIEGRDDAITAEFELRQVVQEEPDWALGWYGLGIARLQLARAGVIAKEAPLQTVGVSFEAGAGHALVRALELEPDLAPALGALALAPIPREGASHLGDRLAMLRSLRFGLGPAAMVSAAQVERVAGSRDSAVALLRRALATGGVDSGAVRLELARDLHAAGNPSAGREALFAGAGHSSEAARVAYRHELEWVAEPDEMVEWDSTTTDARPDWLRRFWGKRDVEAGWPEGTRLIEHYRRVEHAWQHFTLMLPPSGRHRISTRTGGIDTFVEYLILRRLQGAEGLSAAAAESAGKTPVGDALAMLGQLGTSGAGGPFRAFRTSQSVLDDRGVVWIRYGEPSRAGRSSGGEALEVWVYDQVEPKVVLQFREENFDGQVGASVLVPTLLDVPGRFRDQFCGLEISLCTLDTSNPDQRYDDSAGLAGHARRITDQGRITPAVIDRAVRVGEEQIARVTTTDAHPRPFAAKLDPLVQVYGLTDMATGAPRLLAAFALPGDRLAGQRRVEANNRVVYSVRFVLSALDATGHRTDVDTTRHFVAAEPLAEGQFVSGTLEAPLPGGRYGVSLLTEQLDGPGAVSSLGGVRLPGVSRAPWISSLVLGLRGNGVTWNSGTRLVPLHPLNAYRREATAELYYQLGGLRPGEQYRTSIEFFAAAGGDDTPALAVAFTDEATAERQEIQRQLGLENLEPGRYRLRVTITGAGASMSEVAYLTVVAASE